VQKPIHSPGIAWLLAIAGGLAMAIAAISAQSFWIDEAHTAWEAIQPTLPQWWREMVADHGSNLQMPLYMLYTWAWEKTCGHSEWWLRAANIPWLLLGLLALVRRRPEMLVVTVASPFVWYCLDEARPYAMQIGTSLLIFAALCRLSETSGPDFARDERIWFALLACGLVLLSGSSLLGMVWAAAAVGTALAAFSGARSWRLIRSHALIVLAAAPFLLGLACYYLWTLKSGAHPYSGASTNLRNIGFISYELLGFSGLGPGRFEIRTGGSAAFRAYLIPLAVYGGLLVSVLYVGARSILKRTRQKVFVGATLVVCGATLFILATGYVTHFRALGRHCAPLLAIVLWGIAAGLRALWERRFILRRGLAVGFVVASLSSCVSLRLGLRHAKDGYREAAAVARGALAKGEVVWWNADTVAARFYGVPLREPAGAAVSSGALVIQNCTREALERALVPQLIVSSKADLYDVTGALAGYVARGGFQTKGSLPAFTLWGKDRN
jgi:hypothetical protein